VKDTFLTIFLKAVFIFILSIVIGMTYNALSGKGIALVGTWSSKMISDSLLVPPSYVEGIDPQAISLDDAMMYFQSKEAIFVDARYKDEFDYGHIKGAINLPFEEFEKYYGSVKDTVRQAHRPEQSRRKLPLDRTLIIYCSGTDCEASLFLARLLRNFGYRNLKVFFGGWEQWQKANLPTATKE
jgi:3-mercaptopyruvate sulfurtransferase SseA